VTKGPRVGGGDAGADAARPLPRAGAPPPPPQQQQALTADSANPAELLRALLPSSRDAIVVVGRDGRITLANSQAERLFGYTRKELIGMAVETLVPERFRDFHGAHRDSFFAGPGARPMHTGVVVYGRRRGGSEFPAEIALSTVETADDVLTTATIRDDTRRLAAIVDSTDDAIIGKTLDGTITSWNPGAQRLYGYTEAEARGQPISILVPDTRPDEVRQLLRRLARGEHIDRFDTVRTRKDGSLVDVSLTVSAVWDAYGHVVGACTIARDITAAKRAAAALTLARADIDDLFSMSLDPVGIVDAAGYFVRVNAAFATTLGFTPSEIMAQPFTDLIHPDDLEATHNQYAALLEGRDIANFENRYRCKDGSYRWLRWNATGINERGRIYATARDISEERRAAAKLGAANAAIDEFFAMGRDVMGIANAAGYFVRVNQAFADLLGYTAEEITARPLTDWVHPDDRAVTRQQHRNLVAQRRMVAFENRCQCKDGSHRLLQWNSTGINERGLIYATARDITDQRRLEGDLLASREEALAASRSKSEFVASMSHELRTPLNGVIGLTALLEDTPLNSVQEKYLDGLRRSGDALLSVISDVLDFSKMEAGHVELDPTDFDLRAMVEDATQILSDVANAKSLKMKQRIDADVPGTVHGDRARVRQVLLNLLANAIKFTAAGEVTLRVTNDAGERLRFSVADTGIGIDEDRAARLFEAFVQADQSTTRRYGGTGLGLTISSRLVELMAGEIGARPRAGGGSVFWFTAVLPAVAGVASDSSAKPDLEGRRTLIVDDSETNSMIVEQQLRGWGLACESADRPTAALAALEKASNEGHPFELAVLDFNLPQMDGEALLREIRARPALRTLRVVVLSSNTRSVGLLDRLGVCAALTKPVSAADLHSAIVDVFAKSNPEQQRAPSTNGGPSARPLRVLVAEDNEVNAMVAEGLLIAMSLRPEFAINGREAVEMAAAKTFDAILMDCQMPEVDGYEATRQIRTAERGHRVPIIAMTAYAMPGDRERAIQAGMDDYLSKPLRQEDVKAVIERWMLAPAPGQPPARAERDAAPTAASDDGTLDQERISAIRETMAAPKRRLLVGAFAEQTTAFVAAITAAVGSGDHEQVGRLTHQLQGSSATVGAGKLATCCAELGESPTRKPAGGEEPKLSALREAAEQTVAALQHQLID